MLVLNVGMIRSGSTLQHNLLQNTVTVCSDFPLFSHGFYTRKRALANVLRLKLWSLDSAWHVVKMHKVPFLCGFVRPRCCFATYRELGDVARSARVKFGYSCSEIVDEIFKSLRSYDQFVKSGHSLFVFDYEDLVGRPDWAVRMHAAALEIDIREHHVDRILDSMKSGMRPVGKKVDPVTQLHPDHVSNKVSLDAALSKRELDAIEAELADAMERFRKRLVKCDPLS